MATELKPVYLITGGDRPKIQRALRRLRDRIGEDAVELLSASDAGGEDAVAACNSLGLLGGGRRLVIVEEVERWKAADAKAVAAYLTSPAPDTVLALVAAELKKDSALAKACAKAGDLLVFDVVGEDPEELATEVDKISTWAGGDPVGVHEVEQLAAGCAEIPGYELTDAWGRRDLSAALTACQTLLERSGDSVSRTVSSLIGLLVSHVGRVRDCQLLADEGLSSREAASRMKRHPFYVEKLFAQSRNYGPDELREAVVRLAELDHAVKGGSRLAVELELERALIDITRPREAALAAAG
jgi:DNA polymerase III subunit delta